MTNLSDWTTRPIRAQLLSLLLLLLPLLLL
jgi:hypothetical protein